MNVLATTIVYEDVQGNNMSTIISLVAFQDYKMSKDRTFGSSFIDDNNASCVIIYELGSMLTQNLNEKIHLISFCYL